jgi:hypothetical protein
MGCHDAQRGDAMAHGGRRTRGHPRDGGGDRWMVQRWEFGRRGHAGTEQGEILRTL